MAKYRSKRVLKQLVTIHEVKLGKVTSQQSKRTILGRCLKLLIYYAKGVK